MDNVLILFVVLTGIAVIGQAVALFAIYANSKKVGKEVDRFIHEAREVMVPVKSITENLRVASSNLVDIANGAREQFHRVEAMVTETGEALHVQITRLDQTSRDVVDRINETADVVQNSVIRPFREVSALAKGITRGLETFLFRRGRSRVDQAHQDEELFI
jgi:hypothetical protein